MVGFIAHYLLLFTYNLLVCFLEIGLNLYVFTKPKHALERGYLGYYQRPRREGILVWIRGSSVGESLSTLPLIESLHKKRPDATFLVSTDRRTPAEILNKCLPAYAFHVCAPIDSPRVLRRFFEYWRPDIGIMIESCFWPNSIAMAEERSIPLVLQNARMSKKSYQRWKGYAGRMFREVLGKFTVVSVQSPEQKERFVALGISRVEYKGNLKLFAPLRSFSKTEALRMRTQIGQRPFWLAASTHSPEELFFSQIHRQLQKQYPDLLAIIVPRHPERGAEIKKLLSQQGFSVALRSEKEIVTSKNDIYIANTFGEMMLWYHLSAIVVMGKSWLRHGGQNPLEPARSGAAVVCGPYMENFQPLAQEMQQQKAMMICKKNEMLPELLLSLLGSKKKQQEWAKRAQDFIEDRSKHSGLNDITERIDTILFSAERKKGSSAKKERKR